RPTRCRTPPRRRPALAPPDPLPPPPPRRAAAPPPRAAPPSYVSSRFAVAASRWLPCFGLAESVVFDGGGPRKGPPPPPNLGRSRRSAIRSSLHAVRLPPLQVAAFQHRRVHAAARPLAVQHESQLLAHAASACGVEARRGRGHVRGQDHVLHLHQ